MKPAIFKIYFSFLLALAFALQLSAQYLSEDYKWPYSDKIDIVTCRDDGFACINYNHPWSKNHAVIKFNASGKQIFRYDAVPETMFKNYIKKGEVYGPRLLEQSNGNLIVWFSANKEQKCPVDLYYYILSPDGKLLTATAVPFENYKSSKIENPELGTVNMLNDNEYILSLTHGESCKEIFNNSPINKNFLVNINTGEIKALHNLDGNLVMNCVTGNNSIYLLTMPVMYYRNDQGEKSVRQDRMYGLWKFSTSFEKQADFAYWQYFVHMTTMDKMKLEGNLLKVRFRKRIQEEVEYGWQSFDATTLNTAGLKSFKTDAYEHNVYADHSKYFLPGTTLISDATGNDIIFFLAEEATEKTSSYARLGVHAQVVQDGVIRNEKIMKIMDQRSMVAVSQPNSKGDYMVVASGYSWRNYLCNLYSQPLPLYKSGGFSLTQDKEYEDRERAINNLKKRFVKDISIPEGMALQVRELDAKDLFTQPSIQTIKPMKQVFAGKMLMRRGDGYYTGYITDTRNKEYFVYGARFFPGTTVKKPANEPVNKKKPAATEQINKIKSKLPLDKLKRDRPYTFRIINATPLWKKSTFDNLFAESLKKKGITDAEIDSIYSLMNKMPLVVDETDHEIAALWKAYIVAESYGDYLVWVPRDENLDMEEDYIPKEPDGFFVSMEMSDSNPSEDELRFAERKRARLQDPTVPGPRRAIMDGKTKYLDGLSRGNVFTIKNFSNNVNTAMDKAAYHYYCWDQMKGLGLNRAQIDKIGNILQNFPLPVDKIDNATAEKWKAYIIGGTGNNYLLWIPRDENMHMPEEYQPKDPDGFTMFLLTR